MLSASRSCRTAHTTMGAPSQPPEVAGCCPTTRREATPITTRTRRSKWCIQDRIPVGVIGKVDTRRRQVQYEVLGLARPVRWYGGYFILESVNPPAATQVDALTDVLVADSEAESDQGADDVPADDYDANLGGARRGR